MPAAYSLDLRVRVADAVREGLPPGHAASLFKVSLSTVTRWSRRLRTTGGCAASPSGGDRRSMPLEEREDYLMDLTAAEPDLTLAEIQARLEAAHGLRKAVSSLHRFFRRHKVTFKKNSVRRRTGPRGREDGAGSLAGGPARAGPPASGVHR